MHLVMASNLQNTNKKKQSNLKPVISLQSGGTMKCARTSESLTQKIRGSVCSPHNQLVQCNRWFNRELELGLTY